MIKWMKKKKSYVKMMWFQMSITINYLNKWIYYKILILDKEFYAQFKFCFKIIKQQVFEIKRF